MEQQYGEVVGNYLNPDLMKSAIGQDNYQDLADAAYGINRQTGQIGNIGLNDQQQANILGLDPNTGGLAGVNPMTDAQAAGLQLSPEEAASIKGNPADAIAGLQGNLGGLDQTTQAGVSGIENAAGTGAQGIRGSVDPSAIGLDPAIQARIASSLGTEDTRLQGAANNPNLGLSDQFSQNYKVTPQDQQNIIEAAGQAAGGRYRADESALDIAAAAAGNASPLAIAARKGEMERQGAIQAGNAMTNAAIQAKQLQLGTTQQAEQMRLGSAQDIASRGMQAAESAGGLQAGTATTTQGQEIGASEAGQRLGLGAAEAAGNLEYQGAAAGAGMAEQEGQYKTGTVLGAQQTADQLASSRAANVAANRQGVGLQTQATQYTQGKGVSDDMSQRYGGVYGTNLAAQQQQRGYLGGMYGSQVQQQQTGIGQRLGQIKDQGNLGLNTYKTAYQAQSPSIYSQIAQGVGSAAAAYFGA
jgi:hypothetical protein